MANFIEINELRFPTAIDKPSREFKERGLKETSKTGKTLRVLNKRAHDYIVDSPPLTPLQADMFFNLIKGRGHFYPFLNDLWSSKGLSPDTTPSDWDLVDGHHDGALEVSSGEAVFLLPIEGDWSVSFWLIDSTDVHYLVDSEDTVLEDGSSSSLPTGISISGDTLVVSDSTISDLIVLESLVTDDFVQSRIDSTTQFGWLPELKLTGLAFDGTFYCEGDIEDTENVAFGKNGSFYPNGMVLSAIFEEI